MISKEIKLSRIMVYITGICDNDDYTKPAYPWYYVRLPRPYKRTGRISLGWGVVLSHAIEAHFFYNRKALDLELKMRCWED